MYHIWFSAEAAQARKHGMEEFIAADPITFDHQRNFAQLQTFALNWRIKDPFASLVSKCNLQLARRWKEQHIANLMNRDT